MSVLTIPVHEFDEEMASTRRLLQRVPTEHGAWRPHEKSFPLGHLAQLVAWMPGWIARTLRQPVVDLAAGVSYSFLPTEQLLAEFDRNVVAARDALTEVTGGALEEPWSLTMGERVLVTMPRGAAARWHLNHLIHHRGQLTVYLRLVEVPLPQLYGPTADERW